LTLGPATTAVEQGAEKEITKNEHARNVAALSNEVQSYADKIRELEKQLQEGKPLWK
jgi:hypothetical protein